MKKANGQIIAANEVRHTIAKLGAAAAARQAGEHAGLQQ